MATAMCNTKYRANVLYVCSMQGLKPNKIKTPANIHIFRSLLKTDLYTLIEQSTNSVNFMARYIITL